MANADCKKALLQCLQSPEEAKRAAFFEEQCATLAAENERLRSRLKEKESKENTEEHGALVRQRSLQYGSQQFSKRKDDDSTLTSAAAIVAAAEATANYQRSLVRITIDNSSSQAAGTAVTVHAPNRRRLLGDMSGALTGLGLTIVAADIEADGVSAKAAVLRFNVLEAALPITEQARLLQIEQRLQHASTGREGLAGGVKALVVPTSLRATPPWPHEPLDDSKPPKDVEAAWIETLREALGPSSEAAFGAFSCANAKRLAIDLLPELHRYLVPPGVEISHDEISGAGGSWLLLLESSDAKLTVPIDTAEAPRRRRSSITPPMSAVAASAAAPANGNGAPAPAANGDTPADPSPVATRPRTGRRGSTIRRLSVAAVAEVAIALHRSESAVASPEVHLPAGSLLWDTATPAGHPAKPAGDAAGALPPAQRGQRWKSVGRADGEGLVVRACPLSTVRQLLVTLREAAAREHAQVSNKLSSRSQRGAPVGAGPLAAGRVAMPGGAAFTACRQGSHAPVGARRVHRSSPTSLSSRLSPQLSSSRSAAAQPSSRCRRGTRCSRP